MNWIITTPPEFPLLSWKELRAHLRIEDRGPPYRDEYPYDEEEGEDDINPDEQYVMSLLDSAVAYAETKMETSLLDQAITATFYAGDELFLPRGPIIAVVSVTDAQGNSIPFELTQTGHRTYLWPKTSIRHPLTVVYRAGYASADQVPADIVNAIRVHVGTMYQHRESISERTVNDVHRLDEFYRFRSRTSPVR